MRDGEEESVGDEGGVWLWEHKRSAGVSWVEQGDNYSEADIWNKVRDGIETSELNESELLK
jgi:hypothetical protein